MSRRLWIVGACVMERGPCGSLRCYMGEAAEIMRMVLRYSRRAA